MTGHRDHAMLDISVISAVQELSGATRARILNIATVSGQQALRARATIHKGRPARLEDIHDGAPGEALAAYPALMRCLTEHRASTEAVEADGMRTLWLPIWCGDKAATCLEIRDDKPFCSDAIHMVGGIVGVYRNFQNLLDYSERDSLTACSTARPSTTSWRACCIAPSNVENHRFPQVGRITVSVGFVSLSAFESPVVTLGHADQALYHAKSSGRNRASHYDDLVSHGVVQTVASNDTAEFV